ncbi:MAG: SpoIIE family protein phosphatase [Candidatus Omnitrophota bacterium]|nr:MAG: SpoIIE family protein phosphatase [Candidatus Omnitrophota bacterium]
MRHRLYKKIPPVYLDEFLKQQTALIKGRVRLAALLFVASFFIGSLVNTFLLGKEFTPPITAVWLLSACVCIITFALSGKLSTIRRAWFSAALFMLTVLAVMSIYYIVQNDPPFDVAMGYIFMFLGFSLVFPWSPNGIIAVMLSHCGGYTIYLLNTQTFIYKNNTVLMEPPDYLHGFIIIFLAFIVFYVVSKRDRKRKIENFVLFKEIEEKNKQMQRELELATSVHSRLIPHSTSTPLADIAVTYLPMYYMGGDYAKFHFIDKNKLIFIICDVTGHGVSAALIVNAFNTEFEQLAKEGIEPGRLLKEMDSFFIKDFAESGMYLTAFCGLLDFRSKKFMYSSYGHPPQYVYQANNSEFRKISALTRLLGIPSEDENIYQSEITFNKGDHILLFTDGVIESRDFEGKEYSIERLEDFIRKNRKAQVDSFNEQLVSELNMFTGKKFNDDIFILNIRIKRLSSPLTSLLDSSR